MAHRDSFFRDLCDNPRDYDLTIDWIRENNPAAEGSDEWAVNVVHSCIRAVVFGDCGAWCMTGACVAILGPFSNPKRVMLAVRPIHT